MADGLSLVQKLVRLLPQRMAGNIESESRRWMITCNECGSTKSVWDYGGIRWKAAGKPQTRVKCASCNRVTWHSIVYCDGPG